ncbi:MAG: lysylphosphatidylglycerol synthase transmembrane domain-containing protein [Clostridia bacterium]
MCEKKTESGKQSGRLKLIWQIVYIFGTLLLMSLLGLGDPDFINFFSGKQPVNSSWLILCGIAMLGFWLLQACVYASAASIVGAKISFWCNLRITMFGEYYSAITPFASGGQPMQLGYYKRYGVGAAKASSILSVRYICFVGSISLCYLCAAIVAGEQILRNYPLVFWLTTLGFVINFTSLVMVVMILVRPALVRRFGLWLIQLVTKIKRLNARRESWSEKYEKGVVEFGAAGECIKAHPYHCLWVLLQSLLSVGCQFSIAYLVYRALGLSQAGYFELFSMQIFLYLAVAFAPTPGAIGATEGGFYLFFAMVFPKSLLYSAMLMWRLFTYYSNLLFGAALIVGDEVNAMVKARRAKHTLP